jgi:hypothetical protein
VRNKQVAKLFTLLLFGILFVFSFSHFSAITYERVFSRTEVFNEGTMVGSVDISGLTKEEAVEYITTSFNTWFQSSLLSLHYKEVDKRIDSEMFRFSIKESVNTAVNGKVSPLVIHIQEPIYKGMIESFNDELLVDSMDHSSLSRDLLNVVTTMKTGDFDFNLLDYVNKELQSLIISEGAVSISEKQFNLLSEELLNKNQLTIPAMSQFSLLEFINAQSITLSNESLNILGSTLYKTILLSNMEVIERHTSRQLPDFIELGFEAEVTMDNLDLVFYNPNATDYIVNITIQDDVIKMELVGAPLLYKYKIVLEGKTTFPPKSILQFDPKLPLGTSRILDVGKKGYLIRVIRNKIQENGDVLDTKLISEDFYPPVHQVVISSVLSKSVPIDKDGNSEDETGKSGEAEEDTDEEDETDTIDDSVNDE